MLPVCAGDRRGGGAHLVGSVPLPNAEEVFRTVGRELGDRAAPHPRRRDGAAGRLDRLAVPGPQLAPQFEVAPPTPYAYRALPRLRLRSGESGDDIAFEQLGYAEARTVLVPDVQRAQARRRVAARLPLPGVAADAARADQRLRLARRPGGRGARVRGGDRRSRWSGSSPTIPHDQLAVQWDTNVEFGMLEGDVPAWFPDVKGGIARAPDPAQPARSAGCRARVPLLLRARRDDGRGTCPADLSRMVEIANALAAGLDRPLNWVHMPVPRGARATTASSRRSRACASSATTELYLGLAPRRRVDEEDARRAIAAAHELVGEFGVATPCGWGRLPPRDVAGAGRRARRGSAARSPTRAAERGFVFAWPEGFARVPGRGLGRAAGRRVRPALRHGREPRLVPQPRPHRRAARATTCDDGDVLVDYSGGTGILLDRLRLRIFDRQVGIVIVDSSPKFLRVARREVPRRRARRVPAAALPQGREAARSTLDEVLGRAVPGRRRARLDERDPPLRRPRRHAPRVGAGAASRAAASGSTPATSATRAPPRTSGSSTRRCTSSTRSRQGSCAPTRAGPPTATCSTTRSGCAAYLDWRDRVFLAPRPLDYYLDALRAAGFAIEDVDRADDRGERRRVVRVPRRVRRRGARLGRRLREGGRRAAAPEAAAATGSSCCASR